MVHINKAKEFERKIEIGYYIYINFPHTHHQQRFIFRRNEFLTLFTFVKTDTNSSMVIKPYLYWEIGKV